MERGTFRWRRINGVTDVKLKDDDHFRREIMRKCKNLAPLLDDYIPGEPSFGELKRNRKFLNFASSLQGDVELILFVSARDGSNTEKAVGIVDDSNRICAVCHWKAEGNSIEFKIFN